MYYISKGELWAIRRSLEIGEDVDDSLSIIEHILDQPPVELTQEIHYIEEEVYSDGC